MKRKLFLFLCALLTSVGMWAQKDVTSTYITNATLSSLDGWTVSNFNTPQRGNNTVGYATEAYAGYWNFDVSSYSLKQTITLPAGSYRLVNYSFYREGGAYDTAPETSRAKLYAGTTETNLKTLGSITAAGYANSQAEGANCFDSKMYRNVVEFDIAADNTPIEIGVSGTFSGKYCWCIVGQFELFDLNDAASVSSPTDVTYAITNAGFEYRDLTGWTTEKSSDNKDFWYMNNDVLSGKAGIGWVESYEGGGIPNGRAIKQQLTGLDNGLYEVTVYGHLQQGSGSDGFYLYANSDRVAIGSTDQDYSVTTNVTDGNLTIKLATDGCNGNWAAFDKVRMKYYGDPLPAYQELLNAKVATAQALVDGNTIPNAAESALQTVIDNNDNDPATFTTIEQFTTAISNIETAYDTYKALEPNYAAWKAMKAYADALVAVAYVDLVDNAHSTLVDAISTQNTAAENQTTAAGIDEATNALKTAMITYAGAADPTSGNRFDLTFMMTNPSLDAFAAWTPDIPGWDSEETDGNSQVMVNASKTVDDKDHFYEYWSNPAKASGKFALYNAVTLPLGTYSMSCYAFAENQYAAQTVDGVFFYANDTQGSAVTSTVLSEQSISFINESEQEVKIGLKTQTGNTRNWMGIGYITLYKEYTDNTTYDITTNISNADVAVTVDDEPATSAKALKTVTLTVSNFTEGYTVGSVIATYNDGEVKNLDVANPSTNVYTYQQPAYDVIVTINVVVDKSALNTAIADATAARKSANEGTGVFQIPADAGTTLASAIATAQAVYDNASATVSQVADAVTAINTAKTTYEGTTLNAPDAEKRYCIIVATTGHAMEGQAFGIALGATSGNNPTGYTLSTVNTTNQSVAFIQVSGNRYNISFETAEGTTYLTYGTTNGSAAGWSDSQIQATTDATKKGEFEIIATSTAHKFNINNILTSSTIACQSGGNIYTEPGNADFTLDEAVSANMAVNSTAQWGTFCAPFAVEIPSGVTAYTCESASDGVLELTTQDSPIPANTPVILNAESGLVSTTFYGVKVANESDDLITGGMLRGNVGTATKDVPDDGSAYLLQRNNNKTGFYQVTGTGYKIGYNRCYLVDSGVITAREAFFFEDEGETAISEIEAVEAKAQGLKDGKYLINGRIVVVNNGKAFGANGQILK